SDLTTCVTSSSSSKSSLHSQSGEREANSASPVMKKARLDSGDHAGNSLSSSLGTSDCEDVGTKGDDASSAVVPRRSNRSRRVKGSRDIIVSGTDKFIDLK